MKLINLLILNFMVNIIFAVNNTYEKFDLYFNNDNKLIQKNIIIKPINIIIDAPAWIIMNYNTGDIISEKNMNVRKAPASLTKIMTSYIVANEIKLGNLKLNTMIPISKNAATTVGSKMYIKEGSKISVKNLIIGMDVISGNDAAIALAEYISGSEEAFVKLMNQTAKDIGMNNTHFINSNGLPGENQYTTAYDMALLARSYIYNFPEAYKIYKIKGFIWNTTKQDSVNIYNRKQCLPKFNYINGTILKSYTSKNINNKIKNKCNKIFPKNNNFILQNNRNRLLFTFDGADGIKTGYTDDAGYCLVSSAKQNQERFIAVVLGTNNSDKRDSESIKLLRYAFSQYKTMLLYKANEPITITVKHIINAKSRQKMTVSSMKSIYKTIPKSYIPYLKQGIEFNIGLRAPIKIGQNIGNLVIIVNDSNKNKIASIPIIAMNNISSNSLW